MQEQLAGMGAPLSADDLVTTILASLPSSYGTLLSTVIEEYDRRVVDARKTGGTGENAAMATGSQSRGRGRGGKDRRNQKFDKSKAECFNCNRVGHIVRPSNPRRTSRDHLPPQLRNKKKS
ncbi:hypothetical protein BD410DRAFT_790008 [Rickenella mellea]|uniref:CCHC-type domain-containing protein n=1 Tax=Rickenella mellea TaxID=50990 RepID=A0A4Y7Q1F3_9AGAM|nr:hypothetical protein BD410DRAFT_790008 [Rickenella mellea]